ncbi:hypothetical protein LPH50_06500 [Xylella taiwanensis]|nr:hypothetical protein [Xylella taiwanensis]AXI82614.1 hypothetical protein AB672_00815 [Xylella taiwanensis]UFN15066.1 hypothetical protein LPH50_06500 [Xylella taiwanensis]
MLKYQAINKRFNVKTGVLWKIAIPLRKHKQWIMPSWPANLTYQYQKAIIPSQIELLFLMLGSQSGHTKTCNRNLAKHMTQPTHSVVADHFAATAKSFKDASVLNEPRVGT